MTSPAQTQKGLVTVPIPLGTRSYNVLIGQGLIPEFTQHTQDLFKQPRTAIVTDRNVAKHHLAPLTRNLDTHNIDHFTITLEPGEASKSMAVVTDLVYQLLDQGIERQDNIIALGGGVVGDITGFASAILRRGCPFIQVPTSLLAQVDSSVGGKTGVNSPQGKNLIGAFHQPSRVIIDLDSLASLPVRHRKAGYAEIIKYGLISDESFFSWLESYGEGLLAGDVNATRYAIEKSVRAKAEIVSADEEEKGQRALLNLGHTFGHALEGVAGYDDSLLHGEAVGIGMAMALALSYHMGMAPKAEQNRLIHHLQQIGLPTHISHTGRDMPVDQLMSIMGQDKKAQAGQLTFILGPIGQAKICHGVDMDLVRAVLLDFGASKP